jgi:hypothetical protein
MRKHQRDEIARYRPPGYRVREGGRAVFPNGRPATCSKPWPHLRPVRVGSTPRLLARCLDDYAQGQIRARWTALRGSRASNPTRLAPRPQWATWRRGTTKSTCLRPVKSGLSIMPCANSCNGDSCNGVRPMSVIQMTRPTSGHDARRRQTLPNGQQRPSHPTGVHARPKSRRLRPAAEPNRLLLATLDDHGRVGFCHSRR